MRRRDFIADLGEMARGRLAALCELITRVVRTVVIALAFVVPLHAQDLMRNLDLTSPDMTTAEMTRADVEKALASHDTDFNGKKLSGLDLSGLDLSGVQLRAARLNKTKLISRPLKAIKPLSGNRFRCGARL